MKRTALLRRAARLKRGRLRPLSAKRKKLMVERTALLLGLKDLVGYRCEFCRDPKCWPLDGHEIGKPRSRFWLNPEYVCILGRPHHEMAEAAYSSRTGRLVIPGTRSQGWGFQVVYATDKWNAGALTGTRSERQEAGRPTGRSREEMRP